MSIIVLTGESLLAQPEPVEQVNEEHRLSAAGNLVLAARTAQPWLLPAKRINSLDSAMCILICNLTGLNQFDPKPSQTRLT